VRDEIDTIDYKKSLWDLLVFDALRTHTIVPKKYSCYCPSKFNTLHHLPYIMSDDNNNPVVFFDISIGGSPRGRIEME
jgi:hypothetical protein